MRRVEHRIDAGPHRPSLVEVQERLIAIYRGQGGMWSWRVARRRLSRPHLLLLNLPAERDGRLS